MLALLALAVLTSARADDSESLEVAEAAALYRAGLALMARGSWSQACDAFQQVAARPDTELAARAMEKARLIGHLAPRSPCAPKVDVDPDGFSGKRSGRAELLASHAVIGPALIGGVVSSSIGRFDDPLVPVGLSFIGLGLGLGGTLALTSRFPVTSGQAMTIVTAEALGAWNGAAIAGIAQPVDSRIGFHLITAGTVVGGAIGVVAGLELDPEPGQIALVRSGAMWGGGLAACTFLLEPSGGDRDSFLRLAVGSDLGVALGAVIASQLPDIGRGRVNLLNVGGLAGGLAGAGLTAALTGSSDEADRATGAAAMAGSVLGMGVTAWATRRLQPRRLGPRLLR